MNLHVQVIQLTQKVDALERRIKELEEKTDPKPLPASQGRKAG